MDTCESLYFKKESRLLNQKYFFFEVFDLDNKAFFVQAGSYVRFLYYTKKIGLTMLSFLNTVKGEVFEDKFFRQGITKGASEV